MRNYQIRLFHRQLSVKQEIEVDLPRPPPLTGSPADRCFDLLENSNQLSGLMRCLGGGDGVDEIGLRGADGGGFVKRRDLEYRYALILEMFESGANVGFSVSDIAAETDEDFHFERWIST